MKKKLKIMLILVLALALSVGSWCTASASAVAWSNFPQQEVGNYTSHTYAVQAILYRYSYAMRQTLTNNGTMIGVDGTFGNCTDSAVRLYQSLAGLQSDGIVGVNTWTSLWNNVSLSTTSGYYKYYRVNKNYSSSTAICHHYQPTAAATVSGWYAYNDYGTSVFFAY